MYQQIAYYFVLDSGDDSDDDTANSDFYGEFELL